MCHDPEKERYRDRIDAAAALDNLRHVGAIAPGEGSIYHCPDSGHNGDSHWHVTSQRQYKTYLLSGSGAHSGPIAPLGPCVR